MQDATTDVSGSTVTGDWGSNFYTKYDYSSYEQFHQAHTEYGSQYAISSIIQSHDTMTGGPTKQDLMYTNNILMSEFLSGHYGNSSYSYVPPQGVDSSRLFGPYVFRITTTGNETGTQLYQDAVNSAANYQSLYNNESELLANGYIPSTSRGILQASIANPAGWSANTNNNTIVLSDPNTNFQKSHQGYQYWAQIGTNGSATISGVAAGTYRLSLYQLGQWGETRVDGVQVIGNKVSIPKNLKFTPENFSPAAPIWTIGIPNRSANEFLNGHNSSGGDIRNFYGAYDYWKEEQDLGNPGKVVYYATAVGATPATNDPNKWISNQWGKFNPGLYDAANGTSDNYTNIAPAYVTAGGGPATYSGAPWEVHFTTTAAQKAQGQYAVLSVALAGTEGSVTVALNGHSETWHASNATDSMIRSGQSGIYQWLAYQFPTADLNAPGADNVFTFSVSQNDGDQYDALRFEITNTSAAPATTGWHDYEYIPNSNSQFAADETAGLSATNGQSGSSQWALATSGSWSAGGKWQNSIIPGLAGDSATFSGISPITTANVTLDGNRTVGSVTFNAANSAGETYVLVPGTGGSLILDNGAASATIIDQLGTHAINVPVVLNSNAVVTTTNAGDSITIGGAISGSASLTASGAGAIVLGGANTYTGATTINSGLLTLSATGSLASTTVTVAGGATFNAIGSLSPSTSLTSNGLTSFGANAATAGPVARSLQSLAIGAAGVVTLNSSPAHANRTVLVTSALSFAGSAGAWHGKMDIEDNDVIVKGGLYANLASQLQQGFNIATGYWNGAAGIESSTAAADSTHLTTLGMIVNNDGSGHTIYGAGASLGLFDGQDPAVNDVLIKYTYFGDADLSGKIDGNDYAKIDNGFNNHLAGWFNGDFNYDGTIDGSDYSLIDNAFNMQGNSLTETAASSAAMVAGSTAEMISATTSVPEPASLMCIACVGSVLLATRRRHRCQADRS